MVVDAKNCDTCQIKLNFNTFQIHCCAAQRQNKKKNWDTVQILLDLTVVKELENLTFLLYDSLRL